MKYDFNRVVSRRDTDCAKYDLAAKMGKPADIVPLWVADMDFPAPREVIERLAAAARHGIFGYAAVGEGYFQAAAEWFRRRFDFHPEPQWLVTTPGVVFAAAAAIRGLTEPGGAVLIQEPVYHPFRAMITANGRRVVNNALTFQKGKYTLDLVDFERQITEHAVRLYILCSPHNPVGRVWTEAELTALGEICLRRGCLVFADEIHCDFVWPGYRHRVFASLSPEFAAISVTATAPSKTFNLAGLQAANVFIPDPELRKQFQRAKTETGYGELNNMALAAGRAAYEYGRDWLEQLLDYLGGNLAWLKEALADIPQIKMVEPEGTYLVWLDMRGLGLSGDALDDFLTNRAGLWLSEGQNFGEAGLGFYRLNLACPRPILEEAVRRLKGALETI